jgi:hypothetical protein
MSGLGSRDGTRAAIVAAVDTSELTGSAAGRCADQLRSQAQACREIGSPLYGDLLFRAADDLLSGGPVAGVLAGHPAAGSPHAWAALRRTLADERDTIRHWLERPPQTNEVGRAAALLGGLLHITAQQRLPVRLVEVGASAGLNLRADRFCVLGDTGRYGDPRSPVVLRHGWQGLAPPAGRVEIIERTGGDLAPIDPASREGRLRLSAYVWPDQAERLARLRGALVIAGQMPADLRAESATATLARTALAPGTWTVVWHSIFRQYLNDAERAELADGVAQLGRAATPKARFAYLYLEQSRAGGCPVTLATWPGGRREVLGTAPPHGIPVRWR